jgi:CheY-like chemotaxis protein
VPIEWKLKNQGFRVYFPHRVDVFGREHHTSGCRKPNTRDANYRRNTKYFLRHGTCVPENAHFGEDTAMQIGVETSRAVENKRIFVVDDDDIIRAVAQFMLQDDNETHDLANLAEAYGKGTPDLLLLGLSIVEACGPNLLGSIADRWPNTRILLIAESNADATAHSYLKAGAHGVLTRPFTVESIRRKVDIQLGRIVPSLIQLQLVPAGGR